MTRRSPKEVTESLRFAAHRAAVQGDAQYQLARIQRFMGCGGISQCAGDVADEAIKRLGGDPYSRDNQ